MVMELKSTSSLTKPPEPDEAILESAFAKLSYDSQQERSEYKGRAGQKVWKFNLYIPDKKLIPILLKAIQADLRELLEKGGIPASDFYSTGTGLPMIDDKMGNQFTHQFGFFANSDAVRQIFEKYLKTKKVEVFQSPTKK